MRIVIACSIDGPAHAANGSCNECFMYLCDAHFSEHDCRKPLEMEDREKVEKANSVFLAGHRLAVKILTDSKILEKI